MSEQIAKMFLQSSLRIHYRTLLRASDAKTEIRAMAEHARRSIGQRVRWASRG